jgi:VWFA-related protein
MPIRSFFALVGLCTLSPLVLTSSGQTPADTSPTLTLHAGTRIVLTDVTVTDRHGNPVHGLPASAFHISDNNEPEVLASFDEHVDAPSILSPTPAAPAGTFSNGSLQHLSPLLNILVLDTTNLNLPDQMYLSLQLTKFVNALPEGRPIAIFNRHGDTAVILQTFTSDHALLLAAVRKALPHIVLTGREYRSDIETLHQVASYLSQVPGRKNVLWFSGGSTAFLLDPLPEANPAAPASPIAAATPPTAAPPAGPTSTFTPTTVNADRTRQVYDELEAARIAVYPIDVRSLTVENSYSMGAQQTQMNGTAEATGGQAFFNKSGIQQIASHIVSTDSSFYTLSYSPHNFRYDNKWHTVRVTLDGTPYHLSYRRGYFADPAGDPVSGSSHKPPASLLTDGSTPTTPDIRSAPIIFQATVLPASDPTLASETDFVRIHPPLPPKKGVTPITIRYSLPADAFTTQPVDGKHRAVAVVAVLALDHEGLRVAQHADEVTLNFTSANSDHPIKIEQQLDLAKGDTFLNLVVWDTLTGRTGTLQVPLQVPSPPK